MSMKFKSTKFLNDCSFIFSDKNGAVDGYFMYAWCCTDGFSCILGGALMVFTFMLGGALMVFTCMLGGSQMVLICVLGGALMVLTCVLSGALMV